LIDFDKLLRWYVEIYALAWSKSEEPQLTLLDKSQTLNGQKDQWFLKRNKFPSVHYTQENIDALKKLSSSYSETISKLCDDWTVMTDFDFENQYKSELLDRGKAYVNLFWAYLDKQIKFASGDTTVDISDIAYSESSTIINIVYDILKTKGLSHEEALRDSQKFFSSETFQKIPIINLSALLWTALARRYSVVGQKVNAEGSIVRDINTISTVLPHCDAMLIDKQCAQLLKDSGKY